MKFMLFFMCLLTILISMLKNPLFMVMIILLQTLLIGYLIGNLYTTFWISYILILIFLGGMLVIFIYIASLTSNENFSLNINPPQMLMILTILFIFMNLSNHNIFSLPSKMKMLNMKEYFPLSSMTHMYNASMMTTTLLLAIYLMLTLFIIVKICNFSKAPLKKK